MIPLFGFPRSLYAADVDGTGDADWQFDHADITAVLEAT